MSDIRYIVRARYRGEVHKYWTGSEWTHSKGHAAQYNVIVAAQIVEDKDENPSREEISAAFDILSSDSN
jgi:hypothetical protein